MTRIGDHHAAASLQLPVTLPPRVAGADTVETFDAAALSGGSRGARPTLRQHGEGKTPDDLKAAFTQFVGETFYGQMIKAMRSTVGKPAYFHGGRGEEVFQGQLDQQLAQHLTEATADKFTGPLFEHQFPHFAERTKCADVQQLSMLRRQ
jgi:hypothetical protein